MLVREKVRNAVVTVLSDPASRIAYSSCDVGLTLAEERIMDSHQDPLQLLEDGELPCVVVYTDDEIADLPNSHGEGDVRFVSQLEIVLELYVCDETSFELEQKMDLLEEQVRVKLLYDSRFLCEIRRVTGYQSRRLTDADSRHRLGARIVRILVEYAENPLPIPCPDELFETLDLTVKPTHFGEDTDPVRAEIEIPQDP